MRSKLKVKTDKAVRTPEKTSAGGTTLVPVDHGLEDVSEDRVKGDKQTKNKKEPSNDKGSKRRYILFVGLSV